MIYQVKLLKPNFFLQSIFYRCKDQGISLCIINKEMKDVFVCYAREEEEEKRKYIAVEAAWPPRSCCFLCNVLYKFYGIVIIKQTPYAGLFPSICYLYLGFLLV